MVQPDVCTSEQAAPWFSLTCARLSRQLYVSPEEPPNIPTLTVRLLRTFRKTPSSPSFFVLFLEKREDF